MVDKRRSYIVVLDTETCPLDKDFKGVTPYNMFVYDIGWAVVDKKGNVYETKSYINRDIFMDEKDLMQSAYYSKKIPKYWDDIKSGKRKVASWYEIRKDLFDTMKKYNTKIVSAHNARFDDGATKNTQRWLTKSKYRSFLPYGTIIWDTMKMANDVIAKTPTYRAFCEENGYMTKHKTPRPQVKAEVLYKYISGNDDFVESHTGLEDVLIEKEILAYCFRKHKTMRKRLYEDKVAPKPKTKTTEKKKVHKYKHLTGKTLSELISKHFDYEDTLRGLDKEKEFSEFKEFLFSNYTYYELTHVKF